MHTNSGIHNKAAFLLTDGGTFNGRIVSGIGQSKAQQLFYNVLTGWVGSNAKFQDARNGMVFYALTTYGAQSKELCAVRNAYAAVEIGQGDANCDGVEDGSQPDNDGDQTPDGGDNCPNIANWSQGDIDRTARATRATMTSTTTATPTRPITASTHPTQIKPTITAARPATPAKTATKIRSRI